MKEAIKLKGFYSYMNLAEDSYIAFNYKENTYDNIEEIEVIFYTPSQYIEGHIENDELEKLDFDGFKETIMEELFPYSTLKDGAELRNYEDRVTANVSKITDHNNLTVEVNIFELYKNSSSLNVEKVISDIKRESETIRRETLESYKEGVEFQKDPYSYYGVSRKDFF